MLAARVHRLYVEDGTGALVGVVSIKDIISHIVQRLSAP
jgi:CBS domain-containing protein